MGNKGRCKFNFIRHFQIFLKNCCTPYILIGNVWNFWLFCILANILCWLDFKKPFWWAFGGFFQSDFNLRFPDDAWHWIHFHALMGYLYIFLCGVTVQDFWLFKKSYYFSFYYWVIGVSFIFWIQGLYQIHVL